MKIAFAVLFLSASLLAQEQDKVTPELATLKKQHKKELEVADKPVHDRYTASLKSLLRSVTMRGDAASVVAIQAELKAHTNLTALIGLWNYNGPNGPMAREFSADGTFAVEQNGPPNGKWEMSADQLKLTYPNGTDVFPLPVTPQKMVGRSSAAVDVTMRKAQ